MQIKVRKDYSGYSSASDIHQDLLDSRGLTLDPAFPTLPELIKEFGLTNNSLKLAKELITKHIEQDHDILIFGDYDADGITATAVLWTTLFQLARGSNARILPFIPDRVKHGYGLSKRALADIYSGVAFKDSKYPDFSPELLITVDNGIVANAEIDDLKEHKVTTIITDHHQSSSSLPKADLLLHSTTSSGSGLAWVVALYLTDSSPQALSLLDLAVVGIVADQLPLTGINRTLVTHGLAQLAKTSNLGLLSLFSIMELRDQPISTYHINFQLAPRLNAVGRLASATDALRLLCTRDKKLATNLAQTLNELNQERQAYTQQGIDLALQHSPSHSLIISASSEYHAGIVGLIAGRLVEQYQRPAIAISIGDEISKGSARSLGEIDVTSILREFQTDFEGLGGHKLAAGFSVKTSKLEELTHKLELYADQEINKDLLVPTIVVDGLLTLKQTSLSLARLLTTLAPFGLGNPPPRFVSHDLKVLQDKSLGQGGKHHRLTLEQAGVTRQAIWFNASIPSDQPLSSIKELVYSVDINLWRDKESLQLVVKHANI